MLWKRAKPASADHAYLQAKGIKPHNAKQDKDTLIIAAYKGGRISTLQFIKPDGSKLFKKHGEKRGAYGFIGSNKDGRLWIAEGFATAASVHEATGEQVVIAFDCGNLEVVAALMQQKHKGRDIIIAADNDAATEGNPGITHAEATGLPYKAPPMAGDWNDYACEHGLQALRKALAQPLKAPQEPSPLPAHLPEKAQAGGDQALVEIDNDLRVPVDWLPRLEYRITDKGMKRWEKNSPTNFFEIMTLDDAFKDMIWFDEFFLRIMVKIGGEVEKLEDHHVHKVVRLLERRGLGKSKVAIRDALEEVAMSRRRNPAREYFNSLEWDGVPRLEGWLSYYMGAQDEPAEYLAFIGKKWLTAAVNRVMVPGCKFDHVLVIEGEQGKGKSTALRTLATFGDGKDAQEYFSDDMTIKKIEDKDSIQLTAGRVIIELQELVGMNKKDDDEIKRWITMREDGARAAYARYFNEVPRQFVIAGTTNSYDYLRDPTGNRRFWPFKSYSVDIKALEQDRKQLWAEAVKCYRDGLYIGPTEEEARLATMEQLKRLADDPWEGEINKALLELKHRRFTVEEVMNGMQMSLRDKGMGEMRRIAKALRKMGYESVSKRNPETGRAERKWEAVSD